MIITDTTLVGYTVINGSWRLQLAMLFGTIYNNFAYPDDNVIPPYINDKYPELDLVNLLNRCRNMLLWTHSILTVVCFVG
jgi:hypothetical protein